MSDEEVREKLAAALYAMYGDAFADPDFTHDADLLLPVVREIAAEELWEAERKVRAVYDLQCPVMPSDHYVGAGAHTAHTWWQKVLGGALDDLRHRADDLTKPPDGPVR